MILNPIIAKCGHYAATALLLKSICMISPDFLYCPFSCAGNLTLFVLLASLTYDLCKRFYEKERIDPGKKAVFITGCDSGFGKALANRLDGIGFHVFATCLFPDGEGAKELKQSCSERLHILYLDVCKDESVEKALHFVKKNLGYNILWAVVNNAGISKGCSTDFSSMDDFQETLNVNALGPVRVTKAFLPLLKKSKGRVINVTSLCARTASLDAIPYTMSKFAALAFTQCLSLEMKVWGIRAISIEPELFQTGITNREFVTHRMEVEFSKANEDIRALYGEEYLEKLKKFVFKMLNLGCSNTGIVVNDIEAAITEKHPEHVYKPRRNVFVQLSRYVIERTPFGMYENIYRFITFILGYPVPKAVSDGIFN